MQLFRSQGIREAVVAARTRSYRLPWFGLPRHAPAQGAQPAAQREARAPAHVPPQWEDMLVSYDRAA